MGKRLAIAPGQGGLPWMLAGALGLAGMLSLGCGGGSTTGTGPTSSVSADLPLLPEEDATRNHIGLNTWFLNDWDGSRAFADAMKQARPWQDASWSAEAATDELGWPTQDASTVVWTGTPAQVNGTYQGEITLPAGDGLAESSSLAVNLPAGLVALRLDVLTGAFDLHSVSVN